jgi:hypothetical protein
MATTAPPAVGDLVREWRQRRRRSQNVLRLGLHALGLAARIANLPEWRDHLLGRLRRQVTDTGDAVLRALLDELTQYQATNAHTVSDRASRDYAGVVVPLELVTPMGTLAFFGTVTVFGTPLDVTLSELAVEAFFPADAATAELRALPRTEPA